MSGPQNRSLIKLPGSELVMSDPVAGKILTRMVNESLATARTALADAEALLQEGKHRLWGEGIFRNHAEAFGLFSRAAAAGNPEAHFWVGRCYENGHGVGEDDARAVEWYQKSADLGSTNGMFALGERYRDGQKPLPQDSSRAFAFFQEAAENGLAEAQYELGCWYQSGGEVAAMDWVEAAKWFRKAAEQGFEDAQEELGLCYFHGRGVAQDYGEAVKWLRAAAVPGMAASHVLAHCHVLGLCVTCDYAEAAKLSINMNRNPTWLGYQFMSGVWPFPRNYSLAYMWLRVAIMVKDTKGKEGLESLIPRMSSPDLWVGETLFCEIIKEQHWGKAGDVDRSNRAYGEVVLRSLAGHVLGERPEKILVWTMPSEEDTGRLRLFLNKLLES